MPSPPRPPRATPPLLKRLNERTVLEAIRAGAPISRAEISRRAGISKPTVSLALQSLLDAGLVREGSPAPGRPSYGAVYFEPVPDAAFVLGLDAALENDVNLAALGEQWLGVARGLGDFAFLSIGTGMGMGLVVGGELHRGHHGAAGEVDYALAGIVEELDPSAEGLRSLAERLIAEGSQETTVAPPYDGRTLFAAARGGDSLARAVVDEEARRIAAHIAPVAAVTDVALV